MLRHAIPLLLALAAPAGLSAQLAPNPPSANFTPGGPNDPSVGAPNDPTAPSAEQEIITWYVFQARVHRADGTFFEGEIRLRRRAIQQTHAINGQRFTRQIDFSQIDTMRIRQWSGSRTSGSGESRLGGYVFVPTSFELTTHDGHVLEYNAPIDAINSFRMENLFGRTVFYTVFHDAWVQGRGGEYWRVAQSTDYNANQSTPNRQCVTQIEFMDVAPQVVRAPAEGGV